MHGPPGCRDVLGALSPPQGIQRQGVKTTLRPEEKAHCEPRTEASPPARACETPREAAAPGKMGATWMGMKTMYTDMPTRAVGPRMKKANPAQTTMRMGMVAGRGQNKAASNKE